MITQLWHWTRSGGNPESARRSRWRAQAARILNRAASLQTLSDDELRDQAREQAWQLRAGRPIPQATEEVYALVCEAARRSMNMLPYPVQVMGGLALAERRIAEMQTGEGKTLTATLPATLYALAGQGCHVITVNDYLAQRDAELMSPVYQLMGLTVGGVHSDAEDDERRDAYACDVTYGTATEIGFDFLRDRLKAESSDAPHELPRYASSSQASGAVQRGQFFALIDEADSVLIDDAITPLIIGLSEPNTVPAVALLQWSDRVALQLERDVDFLLEPERRNAVLTEQGTHRVLMANRPQWLRQFSNERLFAQVEVALSARFLYRLDQDYVVHQGEITIVDESTGRMMEGRKWQQGLHQAMEVKEGLTVTEDTEHAAQITVQAFFRHYRYLAGMTGTAVQARSELRSVYRIGVSRIPTNRPSQRKQDPLHIYPTDKLRNQALVRQVGELVRKKRAVLIGTPSVRASEKLGGMLTRAGIRHEILNARHEAREAAIVEDAGQPGRVTIATNMAGRGTDIIPHEEVIRQGGLHVIATSIHSSARIDRQLIGRTARQGDPGSYQFLLSMEDSFLRVLPRRLLKQTERVVTRSPEAAASSRLLRYFRRAQRLLEKLHSRQRRQMLKVERERQQTFRRIGLDPYLETAVD